MHTDTYTIEDLNRIQTAVDIFLSQADFPTGPAARKELGAEVVRNAHKAEYRLARILEACDQRTKKFRERRTEILSEHTARDKDGAVKYIQVERINEDTGEPEMVNSNRPVLEDEEGYQDAIKALLGEEEEVTFMKIPMEWLEDIDGPRGQLYYALGDLIYSEDEK